MKTISKIVILIISFSLIFFLLRTQGQFLGYNVDTFVNDVSGTGWLYSTLGLIFAFFAGFSILLESERWNNLSKSVREEAESLHELWLLSRHLSENLKLKFDKNIKEYLKNIINNGWESGEGLKKSIETEQIINSIHNDNYQILKEKSILMPLAFDTYDDVIKYREERVHYLSFHLPAILRYTIIFNGFLLILLSLFIGIKNIFIDYMFTISIVTLVYIVYLILQDLDNPVQEGHWQITTKSYQDLLDKINSQK